VVDERWMLCWLPESCHSATCWVPETNMLWHYPLVARQLGPLSLLRLGPTNPLSSVTKASGSCLMGDHLPG